MLALAVSGSAHLTVTDLTRAEKCPTIQMKTYEKHQAKGKEGIFTSSDVVRISPINQSWRQKKMDDEHRDHKLNKPVMNYTPPAHCTVPGALELTPAGQRLERGLVSP